MWLFPARAAKQAIESGVNFWKHDLVNKLIVLVSLALVAGTIFLAHDLLATPRGSVVYETLFQTGGGIPTSIPVPPTATAVFTPTTAFFPSLTAVQPTGATPTTGAVSTQTPTPLPATATSIAFSTPSATPLSSSLASTGCIPANPRQTGRVLGVIDGNTINVYTDGLVYVVRYIGIAVPKYDGVKEPYGEVAMSRNSNLVYGKDVSLVQDVSEKDPAGRLLRYVLVGNIFVNLELARAGFATAANVAPDTACAQAFSEAEQAARRAQAGRWAATPTPPSH